MDDGALGDLYYLYARRTNLGPFRADVNALWDLAPHDVAIFNYLLDDTPTWVSAVGARVLRNGREDVGFISLGYPSGLIGHIHVSWADPHKVREFVVVGSDRRIAFNDLDVVERVRVFDRGVKAGPDDEPTTFGEHHLQIREGDITSPVVAATRAAQAPVQGTSCTASGGATARRRRRRDGRDVVGRHAGGRAVAGAATARPPPSAREARLEQAKLAASRSLTSPPSSAPWRASCRRRSGARSRGPTGSSGAEVDAFEREFAAYCEVPYAVGVDSGLSALELVLRACGRRPGRRGHHRGEHVHRHGAGHLARRRDARPRRRRSGDLRARPGAASTRR